MFHYLPKDIKVMTGSVPTKANLTTFSYSRIKTYDECPKRAKYKYIEGKDEPSGEAAQKGTDIHEAIETWFKDPTAPTKKFHKNVLRMEQLKSEAGELQVELQVALNRDWARVDWFSPDIWLRGIFDLVIYNAETRSLLIVDWKTGKPRESHHEQLELYALLGFHVWPAYSVDSRVFYTSKPDGPMVRTVYSQNDMVAIKEKWEDRLAYIEKDHAFPANPGGHCRWCHFRRTNEGPCVYG